MEEKMGSKFSLKFFHDIILKCGDLPYSLLKEYFEKKIQKFMIELYEYIIRVNITSVGELMRYIETMFPKEYYSNFQEIKPQIEDAIIKILEKKSEFKITGITGLFKAKKPIKT